MNTRNNHIRIKNRLGAMLGAITLLGLVGTVDAGIAAPAAPKLDAHTFVLLDYDSNQVLAEEKSNERVEPASLTKMMTVYVVEKELQSGNIKPTDMVRISEKAWRTPGSRMFVEVNSQVPVQELLKGVIVQSGNDASVALAEHVAGSEDAFASLMNGYAKQLGMTGSHFVNATGLPHDEHYTTARDMARLARALIHEFPNNYGLYSIKEFTYNGIKQYNRNKLLWQDKFVDGIKTGHTETAGFCLVASAKRGDMRLISVVLGTKNENARANESQKLLTYGFRFYETHRLYAAGQPLTNARVWKGEIENMPLGLAKDVYVTIPRGRYKDLQASMSIDSLITAPAVKGKSYGTVNVVLGSDQLVEQDLVSLQGVPEGGVWRSLVDEIKLVFE